MVDGFNMLMECIHNVYLSLAQCYLFGSTLWQFLFYGAVLTIIFRTVIGRMG